MELRNRYDDAVIERGEDYVNNVNYCIKVGNVLYAKVEGTRTYKTKVNIDTLEGDCSCPYGTNCKHAVAVCLVYEKGDYINSDRFIEYLHSLSKRKLIQIIIDNLHNNPKIALRHNLTKTTNFESFVDDFIDDFSYSKMNKAENLLENFSFEQLMRMIEFLEKEEDNIFEKIYEDYDIADEGDVLYDFEYKLKEELVRKITTEEQIRQVLKLHTVDGEIVDNAEQLVKFKDMIKSSFDNDHYFMFLLKLENPDLIEIKESIMKSGTDILYTVPDYNFPLAEKLSNFLDDKKLLFLVALYKEDYSNVIKHAEVLDKMDFSIKANIGKLIDLLIKNKSKDESIAKKLLKSEFIEILKKHQIEYLTNIIQDYPHLREQLNFKEQYHKERFRKNIILLKRMFVLDKEKTKKVIDSQKSLLEKRDWNDIVELLKFLRDGYGGEYITDLIKKYEDVFKTSSTLKSNLKKEGIFINYSKGIFNVEVNQI